MIESSTFYYANYSRPTPRINYRTAKHHLHRTRVIISLVTILLLSGCRKYPASDYIERTWSRSIVSTDPFTRQYRLDFRSSIKFTSNGEVVEATQDGPYAPITRNIGKYRVLTNNSIEITWIQTFDCTLRKMCIQRPVGTPIQLTVSIWKNSRGNLVLEIGNWESVEESKHVDFMFRSNKLIN